MIDLDVVAILIATIEKDCFLLLFFCFYNNLIYPHVLLFLALFVVMFGC